ncbi:MAG: acyl carrier protein [Pyrinomonadaceae bacterium]
MQLDLREKSIDDVFVIVERIAREELHPAIDFQWNSRWEDFMKVGNSLTKPDGFDLVELVMRLEEEFSIIISDEEAEKQKTVEQTVRYVWETISR